MRNSDKNELKQKYKRIGLFLLIVLVPCIVMCSILIIVNLPRWASILILVCLLFVLFPLFNLVCTKLDERKKKRLQQKKDPFSE